MSACTMQVVLRWPRPSRQARRERALAVGASRPGRRSADKPRRRRGHAGAWHLDGGAAPKQLTQAMADTAERTITMGCGVDSEACPARFMVTEDWGLDDPAGQPIEKVREIRDQIRIRVQALLDELENKR